MSSRIADGFGARQSRRDDASLRDETAFFDQLVHDCGDFNPFAQRGWDTLARRFQDFVPLDRACDILDIGCGTGQSRQIYFPSAARFVGVDLSQAAIARARQRFPGSEWHVADARQLEFADASFDVVAFSSVLHHIPDYPAALAEAFRVLRPSGFVFAFDPNLLHPAMALFRHPRSPCYLSQGVSPNERPLLPGALRRAFAAAGLVGLRQVCQSDMPYREVAPRLINALLRIYNVADWCWDQVGLGRWLGTFVVTCGQRPALSATNCAERRVAA